MARKVFHQHLACRLEIPTVHAEADQPDPEGVLFIVIVDHFRLDALLRQRHPVHLRCELLESKQHFRIFRVWKTGERDLVFLNLQSLKPTVACGIFSQNCPKVTRANRRSGIVHSRDQFLIHPEPPSRGFGEKRPPAIKEVQKPSQGLPGMLIQREADRHTIWRFFIHAVQIGSRLFRNLLLVLFVAHKIFLRLAFRFLGGCGIFRLSFPV